MLLLGIIGLAGSGKTTYAKGKKFETYSFLSPVEIICAYILGEKLEKDKTYEVCLEGIGLDFSSNEGVNLTMNPGALTKCTGRELLQYVGTDYIVKHYGKHFHKRVWVNMLMTKVYANTTENIVTVDDVMYQHEVDVLDTLTLIVTDGVKPLGHKSEKLASKMTKAFRNGTFAKKYPNVKVVYNREIEGKIYWSDYRFYPSVGELFPEEKKV